MMDVAERIEKKMRAYGFETSEEMINALENQKPLDISIFVEGGGIREHEEKVVRMA